MNYLIVSIVSSCQCETVTLDQMLNPQRKMENTSHLIYFHHIASHVSPSYSSFCVNHSRVTCVSSPGSEQQSHVLFAFSHHMCRCRKCELHDEGFRVLQKHSALVCFSFSLESFLSDPMRGTDTVSQA